MEFVNVYDEKYLKACRSKHIKFKLKVELLDWYEFTMGEITRDVSKTDNGKIHITNAQGSRRSCDLTLSNIDHKYNPNENSHFWIDKKFKLYYGVECNGDTYWFSKGVYVTTGASADMAGKSLSLQGADKFTVLTSNENAQRFGGSIVIEQGQPFDEAIRGLLTLNIGNNRPIDPIDPVIDDIIRTKTVPYDIVKNADTSVGDLLIEFADIMDADIWYDDDGRLYFSKSVIEDSVNRYEQFSSQWDFVERDSYFTEATLDSEQTNMINTVVVTNASSEEGFDAYFAENDHPQSPLRVSLVGTKATEVVSTEMGYNEQRRKEYANRLLQTQCLNAYAIKFSTISIPHLDVNRTVTVTYKDYGFDKEIFILQDIDIDIEKGIMSLSATQIVWLPGYSDSGAANFDTHEITPNTYKISFDIGNSTVGTAPVDRYKNQGDVFSLPTSSNFSRANYNFEGWRSNVDGRVYPTGYSFTVGTQNVTFVAQWASIERPANYWTLKYILTPDKNTITLHPLTSRHLTGVINWGDGTDDQNCVLSDIYTHTYKVESATKTVVVKLFANIEDTEYLDDLFCYDGVTDYHTVSQLEYIKFPNSISIIPKGVLNNTAYNTYPNWFKNLTTIILPPNATNIPDDSFSNCISVSTIELPQTLTYIGSRVLQNSAISELVIPENLTACGIQNMPLLEKVTILSAGSQLVAPTLANSPKLKDITVGGNIICVSNGWFYGVSSLANEVTVTLQEGVLGVLNGALSQECIKSLVLPDSLQYIGSGALNGAGITQLKIPYTCYVDTYSIPTGCQISFKETPATRYSITSNAVTSVTGSASLVYNGESQKLSLTFANPDGTSHRYIRKGTPWSENGRAFLQSIGRSVSEYECCELIEGVDYVLSDRYGSSPPMATRAGSHTVYLQGIGRMTGKTSRVVTIQQATFSKTVTINGITNEVPADNINIEGIIYDVDYYIGNTSYVYKPSGYTPNISITSTFGTTEDTLVRITSTSDSSQTKKGNSYYIRSSINGTSSYNPLFVDVGKYLCDINATTNGSYTGSIVHYTDGVNRYSNIYYKIIAKNITDEDIIVNFKDIYEYTGEIIKPILELSYVYDGGNIYTLVENKDYTVVVSDSTTENGTVTATGIGNFTGELVFNFKINAPVTEIQSGEETQQEVYAGYVTQGEEQIPALVYNPSYNSFDLFTRANSIINVGSKDTSILNLNSPILNIPNLTKTGSGAFNLTITDSGEVLKRSSAKKYKTNISYDINTDYWHNVFMNLKTGSYNYKTTPDIFELGMFADDIAAICPEIARYSKDGVENYDDRAIIQMLVMEVQRLNKEIQEIKGSP